LEQHFFAAGGAETLPVDPVMDGGSGDFLHQRIQTNSLGSLVSDQFSLLSTDSCARVALVP
jgi:hypothetical protein